MLTDITLLVLIGLGIVLLATLGLILALALQRARAIRPLVSLQSQNILRHLRLLPDNTHHMDWHVDSKEEDSVLPLHAPLLPQQTLLYADELGQSTKRVTTINNKPLSRYRAG